MEQRQPKWLTLATCIKLSAQCCCYDPRSRNRTSRLRSLESKFLICPSMVGRGNARDCDGCTARRATRLSSGMEGVDDLILLSRPGGGGRRPA